MSKKLTCPTRTQPRAPGGTRITARDFLILQLVARCQPVSTQQVQAFLACSSDIASRRLRILRDHGLLRVLLDPRGLHRPNLYNLAPPARSVLARALGTYEGDYRAPRTLPRQLDHHLAVGDDFIALTAATTRHGGISLVEVHLDRELRATARRGAQVPDLVAVLEGGGARMAIAVEHDLATEAPDRIANKALAYEQKRRDGQTLQGCARWCVLFIVPDVKRRNRLFQRLACEDLAEDFFYFATEEEVSGQTFLTDIWRSQRLGGDGVLRFPLTDPFHQIRTRPGASHQQARSARKGGATGGAHGEER